MSPYKLGMAENLMIGLVAGSHAFSSPGTYCCYLDLSCASVHASLTLLPRLHEIPNVTPHPLLPQWTFENPFRFGHLTPARALIHPLSAGSS
jgi:hypothetical protein